MLWSVIHVIFKTSSVTSDFFFIFLFFYVFDLILSFSTCSQSFNKICTWEVFGTNVLKIPRLRISRIDGQTRKIENPDNLPEEHLWGTIFENVIVIF